jgi:hypothetical protein
VFLHGGQDQIRDILGTDPDEGIEYLGDLALANLNAELAAIREELSRRQ